MTMPREEAKKVVKNYIKAIGDVLKPLLDIEIQSYCPHCGERMETSEHFCDSCKERVATPTDIDVAPIRRETAKAVFKEVENLMNSLLESVAEIQHEAWFQWSTNIAHNEKISDDRIRRWNKLWKPYDQLTEAEKDQDRIWARKVLDIINNKFQICRHGETNCCSEKICAHGDVNCCGQK